jgi:hypothetical protein
MMGGGTKGLLLKFPRLASFRSIPAILVKAWTLDALPSRIFSYNAKRSGMSSDVVPRGKRTDRDAASSIAMPPMASSQRGFLPS